MKELNSLMYPACRYRLARPGLCALFWGICRVTGQGGLPWPEAGSEKSFSHPFLCSSGIDFIQMSLKLWGTGLGLWTIWRLSETATWGIRPSGSWVWIRVCGTSTLVEERLETSNLIPIKSSELSLDYSGNFKYLFPNWRVTILGLPLSAYLLHLFACYNIVAFVFS